MIELSKLKLSDELLLKLKDKNITTFSEIESSVFNVIINGSSGVLESSVNSLSYLIPFIKKLEGIKKLKPTRKTRLIFIVDNEELCNQLTKEIKSLITKELVVLTSHSGTGLKKIKKKLKNPCDIIVLTLDRLNELVNLSVLKVKCAKHIVIVNYDKFNADELEKILSNAFSTEVDDNDDNSSKAVFQLIVTATNFNKSLKSLMDKYTNGTYENKISKVDSSENELSSDDPISSDEEVVKFNGNKKDKTEESDEVEVAAIVPKANKKEIKATEKVLEKKNEYDIDEKLMSKLRETSQFNKYDSMSKLLIEEFGDIEAVSRLINLVTSVETQKPETVAKQNKKPTVISGSGSKLTGRDGYTAYYFIADKEISSKGYLFKSLKRLIDEELVEKIERVQQTKNMMGFVFDLPSEFDEDFQSTWKDGKYDSMSLLEGDVPELSDSLNRNSGGRGRGGDRGGFRGRGGNDRGARRGNDRGGSRGGPPKRPGAPLVGSNSKVVKFE